MIAFWNALGIRLEDLCSLRGSDDYLFTAVFLVTGAMLAAAAFWARRHPWRRIRQSDSAGVFVPALGTILSAPAGFLLFAGLIPDPRDNGFDCGYTPDAILMPLVAGFYVPIGFVVAYVLLLAFWRLRNRDE